MSQDRNDDASLWDMLSYESDEAFDDVLAEVRNLKWCGIYTRQSRSSQSDFSSCEAQFLACFEFIRSRFEDGWVCNGRRYDDEGESSESLQRPGMDRLLADVRAGKVDRVVVHRLDRISRRLVDCTSLLKELQELKIPLSIVTQPDLGETADYTLLLNLMASVADFEQEMIRDRFAEARSALKAQGRRVAGRVPYGYVTDPQTKQLVLEPREAELVQLMFQLAARGTTPAEIARYINQKGWKTRKRVAKSGRASGGQSWTPRQVLSTLSNPVYAGLIRDGEQTREGIHVPIVDLDLFQAVRRLAESRQTRKPGRKQSSTNWPLREVLRCGRCRRKMSPNTSGYRNFRYRYYRCRSTAGGLPPCAGVRVPAHEIEAFVVANVGQIVEQALQEQQNPESVQVWEQFAQGWNVLTDVRRFALLPLVLAEVVFNPDDSTIQTSIDPDQISSLTLE